MSDLTLEVPRVDVARFSDEMEADPSAIHEQLREAGPVVFIPYH